MVVKGDDQRNVEVLVMHLGSAVNGPEEDVVAVRVDVVGVGAGTEQGHCAVQPVQQRR